MVPIQLDMLLREREKTQSIVQKAAVDMTGDQVLGMNPVVQFLSVKQ